MVDEYVNVNSTISMLRYERNLKLTLIKRGNTRKVKSLELVFSLFCKL